MRNAELKTYWIKVDFNVFLAVTIIIWMLACSLYQLRELQVVAIQFGSVDQVVDEIKLACGSCTGAAAAAAACCHRRLVPIEVGSNDLTIGLQVQ